MKRLTALLIWFTTFFFAGCLAGLPVYTDGEVPFVPTPPEVIVRMLALAAIKGDDVLYDVGSGDGRIVIRAAKTYGIRAVGIEIDRELVEASRAKAKAEGVEHLVEFRLQDALTADFSEASIVTLYMMPEFNAKLEPKLGRLKTGARIVAHDFGLEGWTPTTVERVSSGAALHSHTIYLWTVR